jgi:glycerol-3-phosphate dehydrogenase (NAD(P)+)
MSDVLVEELPGVGTDRIVVLSGPSHAEEVSRNIPTTVVAASENSSLAIKVQEAFSTETFRIYTNPDIRGVELSGSVKNVIAIAAGMCDGLGFGDNTKGALLTRGIAEMMRLGKKFGAQPSTFSGLAGIGDLITTCTSRHSRNRKMGELIASGLNLQQALAKMTMVAEGVETTKSVYQLSQKLDIEMPITQEVYKTLFEGKNVRAAARDLMARESKPEWW